MACDTQVTCPEAHCLKNCECYAATSSECQPQSQSSNNSIPYVIAGVVIFVVLIVILSIVIWQHLRKIKRRENLAGLQVRQHNIRAIQNAITQMEAANQSNIGLVVDQGIPCPQINSSICATFPMNISGAEDASPDSYQINSNIPLGKESVAEGKVACPQKDKESEDLIKDNAEIKTRDYGTGEFANIVVEQILNES